jgi:hypothetical protein
MRLELGEISLRKGWSWLCVEGLGRSKAQEHPLVEAGRSDEGEGRKKQGWPLHPWTVYQVHRQVVK